MNTHRDTDADAHARAHTHLRCETGWKVGIVGIGGLGHLAIKWAVAFGTEGAHTVVLAC